MLIPRFSIKVLLIITAIAAVVALVMREAVRAQPWAIGLCATLAGVAVVFAIYIGLWCAAWVCDQMLAAVWPASSTNGGNPFSSAGPPRQIVPPTEPQ